MRRGGTAVSVMGPRVEIVPTFKADGKRKSGWWKRLKKSVRKLNWWRSPMWKCFISDKSQSDWRGPRKMLRGVLPKPVAPGFEAKPAAGMIGAVVKQAGLM